MFESIGLFLLGLVLLALGGDSIVKGASGLGRHFKLSPFATGSRLSTVMTTSSDSDAPSSSVTLIVTMKLPLSG